MSLSTRARRRAAVPRTVTCGVGPVRRTLDIFVATVLLFLASPFVTVIAVLILVTGGQPVFFRQIRVGEQGCRFVLYKLRTMQVVSSGPEITTQRDSRITPLGAFLRRTGIDELPQLWHVLRGQMTLVGPRPRERHPGRPLPRVVPVDPARPSRPDRSRATALPRTLERPSRRLVRHRDLLPPGPRPPFAWPRTRSTWPPRPSAGPSTISS